MGSAKDFQTRFSGRGDIVQRRTTESNKKI
jgi:hypothetical protein